MGATLSSFDDSVMITFTLLGGYLWETGQAIGLTMSLTSINASDAGARRRRADFVILRTLHEHTSIHCDEIDHRIRDVHGELLQAGVDSPFYFRIGGSNGPESEELDKSVERLLQHERIRTTQDNHYALTDAGRRYLHQTERRRRDGIDEHFEAAVDTALDELSTD